MAVRTAILVVVPDARTLEETLDLVALAADRTRFRLLAHAATEGSFRSSEAAEIAGEDPSSGTVRTVHVRALVRVNLLQRYEHPRVHFEITPLGRAIYDALVSALAATGVSASEVDQVAVLVLLDRETYEGLRRGGESSESLELELRRCVRGSVRDHRRFRVTPED